MREPDNLSTPAPPSPAQSSPEPAVTDHGETRVRTLLGDAASQASNPVVAHHPQTNEQEPPPIWSADALARRPPLSAQSKGHGSIATRVSDLEARAAGYAVDASGAGTKTAYRSAWRTYTTWCAEMDRLPLCGDPGQIALYLTKRADDGLAVSSLGVARAAIRAAHRLAAIPLDLDDAKFALVMEGITRRKGTRPRRQAAPAVPDLLRRLLTALPSPTTPVAAAPALAARHRAMLLIGFGAALRRSEIVTLRVGDVTVVDGRGLSLLIRQSKTDQHGRGRVLAIWANHRDPEFCPLAAFEGWMTFRRQRSRGGALSSPALPGSVPAFRRPAITNDETEMTDQPLFCGITASGALMPGSMSDKIVARLIKQACVLAGVDPSRFSGHSLRRGLLTTAGDLQLPLVDLMRQSRHKSVDTALGYIEAGDAWRNNITETVFRGKRG